jgi:2-keto-4-pentenoate hydratase/2-oxohepta-3-ene-1,7-dioic acid hydratase in catechol pathway
MRLVSYDDDGHWTAAILVGDRVIDARRAALKARILSDSDSWSGARQIVGSGLDYFRALNRAACALSENGGGRDLAAVRLGPPIPDPEKVLLIGLNYRDHAAEANQPIPTFPMIIPAYRNALAGPNDNVRLPFQYRASVDYEGELAFVIGKRCRDVAEENAMEHVAGVMAINDVSARDLQLKTPQWAAGKMVDGFKPCGPAMVTLDEVGNVSALEITTRLNGEVMQHSSTSQFIFSIAQIVATISTFATLEPGDIVATGTPPGIGFTRKPPVFLRSGDVIEVEIGGVGRIANTVVEAR